MLEDSRCSAPTDFRPAEHSIRICNGLERPTIGLFDSGVGGLSVLQELLNQFPEADYIYLGDTARVPYGTRSVKTVTRYSMQAAQFLVNQHVDMIVIACNTASSVALSATQKAYPAQLAVGIVDAGAQAAVEAAPGGKIAVIGTECTVAARAYERAIKRKNPQAEVYSAPCSLLVSLAEEGWTEGDVAEIVMQRYLSPLLTKFGEGKPDCIVLGCTHFTQFHSVIQRIIPPGVKLINPAEKLGQMLGECMPPQFWTAQAGNGDVKYFVTDAQTRFARVGELFLGRSIETDSLQTVTLDNI